MLVKPRSPKWAYIHVVLGTYYNFLGGILVDHFHFSLLVIHEGETLGGIADSFFLAH